MTTALKIPAYRLAVFDVTTGKEVEVAAQVVNRGPLNDNSSVVNYQYGGHAWTHVLARLKTHEGGFQVTSRYQGHNPNIVSGTPAQPVDVRQPDGRVFRVRSLALPEAEWMQGNVIAFQAPRCTIRHDVAAQGWWVTFEPQQVPCVLTAAVHDRHVKNEALPSFPFPAHMVGFKGSFFIPANNAFGAVAGGMLRLGVRGAGREAMAVLPTGGTSVVVEPGDFLVKAASDQKFLEPAYVQTKFAEHGNLVQYTR